MTIERVKKAAAIRGMRFDGKKRFINNLMGFGYFVQVSTGAFLEADTLSGLYSLILKYPRI